MRCVLCPKNFSVPIRPSWKNPKLLSQFVSPHTGLVYKKHITGLCEFMQCEVEREVKRAQQFGKIFISSILTLFGTGGGGIFLSPCPCWIRFCQLNFFSKISKLFGVDNCHHSGYFEILSSSLILIKVTPCWL